MKSIGKIKFIGAVATVSVILNLVLAFKFLPLPFLSNKSGSEYNVTRVIDGDTFDTKEGDRVRMYEIDAPEFPKDCMSGDSKHRLETMIFDKKVNIVNHGKDNFGRILGNVYLDGVSINELLVEEGLAYYRKDKVLTTTGLTLEKVEIKAKIAERGVWSSQCQTKKEGCNIKGNYRSADTTRIYHTPDCYNYDKITVKDGTSDRWFCTEDEAKEAGFRKSMDCPK